MPVIPLAVGGILVWWITRMYKKMNPTPWSLERIERSSTAKAHGINNKVPNAYVTRARGLGAAAAALEAYGSRITSAYRSRELSAVIRSGLKPGTEVAPFLGGVGDHESARGLDDGVNPGADTREQLEARANEIRANPLVGHYVSKIIIEGVGTKNAHLHIQFSVAGLEKMGQLIQKGENPYV